MDRPSAIYESEKQLKALADVLEGKAYKNTGATNGESKWLKHIAEQIEKNGVGGSSIQPDWNQNDDTADDYIKNRPFYSYNGNITYLGGTYTFAEDDFGYRMTNKEALSDLVEGQLYIVNWDGVDYNCVAFNDGGLLIGNAGIFGSTDTGEPFAIYTTGGIAGIVTTSSGTSHTVSISTYGEVVSKIEEKFLPILIGKLGTGSYSSIFNDYETNVASGMYSHAEGWETTASGRRSHAEGHKTVASADESHSEGNYTTASGQSSHAEGYQTTASGQNSHAEGYDTNATGQGSHAEGDNTTATGHHSHAEGVGTIASKDWQHVQGKYNIKDLVDNYAHIVGCGSDDAHRFNAHTLDWNGNAWYSGTVEGTAMIVKSSTYGSSKRFKITVDDDGVITATEITA